jgi:hypothetical protein
MDQMLYSEEVLSTLHQPDTLHDQEKSQEGPALLSAASTVKSSDNGINGDSIQEDSHELNEAVRTFEQTLQRHLSNTYKDPVGALRIVEEDEEEFNLSYTGINLSMLKQFDNNDQNNISIKNNILKK